MSAFVIILVAILVLISIGLSFLLGFTLGVVLETNAKAGDLDEEREKPKLSLYEEERRAGLW